MLPGESSSRKQCPPLDERRAFQAPSNTSFFARRLVFFIPPSLSSFSLREKFTFSFLRVYMCVYTYIYAAFYPSPFPLPRFFSVTFPANYYSLCWRSFRISPSLSPPRLLARFFLFAKCASALKGDEGEPEFSRHTALFSLPLALHDDNDFFSPFLFPSLYPVFCCPPYSSRIVSSSTYGILRFRTAVERKKRMRKYKHAPGEVESLIPRFTRLNLNFGAPSFELLKKFSFANKLRTSREMF